MNVPSFISVVLLNAASIAVQAQTNPAPSSPVVAKIDGKELTADEVRMMIAAAPPTFFAAFKANPANAIRDFFVLRELSTEAEKLRLDTQSPWKEQLETMRTNILASAMITRELNVYRVPEEQTEKYYHDNLPRFEKVSVRVIKIGFNDAAPAASASDVADAARRALENAHNRSDRPEEDARKLAATIVAELRAGADFKKLAAEHSDDAETRDSGGDFGSITGSSAYPESLKTAALALSPGQTSDPVKVATAYYIIRCDSKTVQSLKDVHDTIVNELKQQHRDQFLKELQQRFTPSGLNSDALTDIANGK